MSEVVVVQKKKPKDVFEFNGRTFYIDGYLKSNLDIAKKIVRNDLDVIGIVDGYPGMGKSTISQQMAAYFDPEFSLDSIGLTTESFERRVMAAKKFSAVIYDEAITGLMSDEWFKETTRVLKKMLNQIRQKNLMLLLNIPTFFDLSKSLVLHRSYFLIHVYSKTGKDGPERGFFLFYDREAMKNLYVYGVKTYNYHAAKPTFWGHFRSGYTVAEAEYRRAKNKAFEKNTDFSYKPIDQRNAAFFALKETLGTSQKVSDKLKQLGINVGRRHIDELIHDFLQLQLAASRRGGGDLSISTINNADGDESAGRADSDAKE